MKNPFVTAKPKAHRKYAPSSISRILKCIPSTGAGANDRDPSANDAADEGQIGHDIFETCMLDGGSADRYIGRKMVPSDGANFVLEVDRHFAAAVDLSTTAARQLAAPRPGDLGPAVVMLEQEVELRGYEKLSAGTSDVIAIRPVVLSTGAQGFFVQIGDLKMGMLEVEAEANGQLLDYAVMALDKWNLWDLVEWVEITIFQPRIFYGDRIKTVTVHVNTLREFRAVLVATIEAGEAGLGEFIAGPHCRYCERLGMCPASADMLENLVRMIHSDPAACNSATLGWFMDVRKTLDSFSKRAEAILKDRGMRGEDIGRPIVLSRKFRQWKDEAAARKVFYMLHGLDIMSAPTPAQIEERFPEDKERVKLLAYTPPGDPVVGAPGDKRTPYTRASLTDIWGQK